jgi:hypothetical protein
MTTLECCANPAQTNLHEVKHVIGDSGSFVAEPCWNRICSRCHTHWYGHPDNLKKYSRAEWDELMSHAFDDCKVNP